MIYTCFITDTQNEKKSKKIYDFEKFISTFVPVMKLINRTYWWWLYVICK